MPDESKIEQIIEGHGASVEADENPPSHAELIDRLAALEFQFETASKNAQLSIEVQNYVSELREELGDLRSARIGIISAALALVFSIFLTLMFFIVQIPQIFFAKEGYFQSSVILVCIGSCALIISILIKGVFRTVAERNADDLLPPHLKALLEAAQIVTQK